MNNNRIDILYDTIDKACMLLYDELEMDYLNALIRVGNDIVFGVNGNQLSDKTIASLNRLYKKLHNLTFQKEDVRIALELLMVKGFKHKNLSLNIMTPDSICYLVSIILKMKFNNKKIKIMDTLLGTSNLLQAVANNLEEDVELIGIEKDEDLVRLSQMACNLSSNEIKIYYQDALVDVYDQVDVVIADLPSTIYNGKEKTILGEHDINYFPYLLIEKRLDNLVNDGYFVLVIDNDFFSQEKVNVFKEYIESKATFLALVVLPINIVQEGHVGKSIIIGKKAVLNNYQMEILNVSSFEKRCLENILDKLQMIVNNL